MLGIEALDLLNARASILGEVEDVDLAVGEDDPRKRELAAYDPELTLATHQCPELPAACCRAAGGLLQTRSDVS